MKSKAKAHFHLPGLFEFYELYKIFIPVFYEHKEYFYDWCDIGSVYGAPPYSLWNGGRIVSGESNVNDVLDLMRAYSISSRLTFSNSLIRREHLSDRNCNDLCRLFTNTGKTENGIIICSDLLLQYIREHYPWFYFVSSTTKVITDWEQLSEELNRDEFRYVVPDFRLNHDFEKLDALPYVQKDKMEFLCNECCFFGCSERKACYENVSRKILGENCPDHKCISPDASEGYVFSKAMHNPGFISIESIQNSYMPIGFSDFKIEGRSLGSAMILEFLLYYMTRSEYQLQVREKIYLNHSLDLF